MFNNPIQRPRSQIRLDFARGTIEGVCIAIDARPDDAEPIALTIRKKLAAAITRLAPGASYEAVSATFIDMCDMAEWLGDDGHVMYDAELILAAQTLRDILNDLED